MSETRPRPFLAVLAEAHLERRTGIVRATRGEGRLAVGLANGRLVALESEGLPIAATSEEDRELAALLAEAWASGESSASRAAARQTLLEALRADDTRGFFEEGASEVAQPPLDLDTEQLLHEAAHTADFAAVESALGPLERPLLTAGDPRARSDTDLTPSEGYLLSRLDGRLTARSVLEMVPLEPEAARRSLFGLLVTGLVRFAAAPAVASAEASERPSSAAAAAAPAAPAPTPSPPRDHKAAVALEERRRTILLTHARVVSEKDHFAVLGLPREATEAEVKAAYFGLVKQFHPDALGSDLQDLRDTVKAVFARVGAAFDVLGDPKTRARYEDSFPKRPVPSPGGEAPGLRRAPPSVPGAPLPPASSSGPSLENLGFFAEESLTRAQTLLGEGKYWEVIQLLESQVDSLPARSRNRGRLVLAQAFVQNPKWLRRGEEVLRTALKDDPKNADAYYLLGTIYKTGGLLTRAASMFRKALDVHPGHQPATDELAALEKAPPPPRKWFRGP
jgi:tetratricopeptide (TPR) repeat protein